MSRRRSLDLMLDFHVRLAALEGVAGVAPGTWTRNPSAGLVLAKAALPGKVDGWFEPGTAMVDAIRTSVLSIEGTTAADAEDVLSSILSGESRSAAVKGGELHDLGRKYGTRLTLVKLKACLERHARHRVARPKGTVESVEVLPDVASPTVDLADAAVRLAGDDATRAWLVWVWRREYVGCPNKLAILEAWAEDFDQSVMTVAKRLGYSPVCYPANADYIYVYTAMRKAASVAARMVERDRIPADVRRILEA